MLSRASCCHACYLLHDLQLGLTSCHVQAAIDPKAAGHHRTALTTLRHVHQTAGLPSLWAGFAPRAFRIMCASIILQVGLLGAEQQRTARYVQLADG